MKTFADWQKFKQEKGYIDDKLKENYLKFFTNPNEIMFYIMPLIHSENIQDQELALEKKFVFLRNQFIKRFHLI